MINLHLHSNKSDGLLSPVELLSKIEENGIDIASITDHDCVDAYLYLRDYNITDYYKGRLITGVEMKGVFHGYPVEIIGYNVDVDFLKSYLDEKCNRILDFQEYIFNEGKKVSKNLNLKFDDIEIERGEYAGKVMYSSLKKYNDYNIKILGEDFLKNNFDFYRNTFSNPESPFYVSEDLLGYPVIDTINKIHEAGGLAFLAHPCQYKMIKDKTAFLDKLCSETGLDGIECYYPLMSNEETNMYLDYCHKNNLLISGGSDFHGTESQNIITQNNIDINNLKWIDKL